MRKEKLQSSVKTPLERKADEGRSLLAEESGWKLPHEETAILGRRPNSFRPKFPHLYRGGHH